MIRIHDDGNYYHFLDRGVAVPKRIVDGLGGPELYEKATWSDYLRAFENDENDAKPVRVVTETRITNALTGGEKGAKPEAFALIPVEPLREVARVYGVGATKYAARNWERGYDWSLSYSALQRHVTAFWGGEDRDAESGLSHLAHAAFHLLAMMEWARTHPEMDDRSKAV